MRDRYTKSLNLNNYEKGINKMIEYFGSVLQSDEQFTGQNTNIDVSIFNAYSGGQIFVFYYWGLNWVYCFLHY